MLRVKKIFPEIIVSAIILLLGFLLLDANFPYSPVISYSTLVYDRNGKLLNVYLSRDEKWRMECSADEVNPLLIRTILQKEDKYFFYHPGINPFAISRAAFNNIIYHKRTSGASTLTMQVVRLLEPKKRTFFNKIKEAFHAMQMEFHYSKIEILNMYLSLAPFGGNIEGIKSASYIYFGKPPALLSPAQAVLLTIIPNRPSSLRPGRNNTLLISERNKWLERLSKEHALSHELLSDAWNEPVSVKKKYLPEFAAHLSRRLHNQYPDKAAINTTIDLNIQQKVQQLCYAHIQQLSTENIKNAAVLVVDNKSHEVIAYVGSQDFHDNAALGQVDGLTAVRSPGSTLKPLLYGLAFDKGIITPKTILADVPVNFSGYSPENFNQRFNGKVTAESALAYSLNIPAVRLLDEISVGQLTQSLIKCNFKSIGANSNSLGLSTILGGCGVTAEEMAGLYCSIANRGKFQPLKFIKDSRPGSTENQIISESSAFLLTEILTKPDRPDLPELFESSLHVPRIAWKTGTSYGRRDAWSIGFNKRYTVAVWVGNFDGTGVPELTGADMATPLLFKIFNSIDYNSSNSWFAATHSLDLRYVCPETGLIPGDLCTDKVMDYFIPGISSMETCQHVKEVAVSPDEKISYCINCIPDAGYKKKVYANPSAELLKYYQEQQIPVNLPPPHNPSCQRIFEGKPPHIISLNDKQEYLIEKSEPKTLELSAAVSADVSSLNWFAGNRFLKKVQAGKKLFFTPVAGKNNISCTDDKGRNSNIEITVSYY